MAKNSSLRVQLPQTPRLPSTASRVSGAPPPQRGVRLSATTLQPYRDPPTGYQDGIYWPVRPLTEWIVYDDITRRRGFRLKVDFLYQQHVPAPGLLASGNNDFRADFWILPSGRGGSPGYPYNMGAVWDPITNFTHSTPGEDRLRRAILAQGGYLLIWMEAEALMTKPHQVIDLALRFADVSSLGRDER